MGFAYSQPGIIFAFKIGFRSKIMCKEYKEGFTFYYPYFERLNLRFWIRLKSGRYVITPRASILDVVRAWYGCQAYNLGFKAEALSGCINGELTPEGCILLYLFYNRLTDRKPGSQV